MPHETPQSRYDSHYVANRMARAIGHVKLVKSMVETGADCTDVLIQLAAVRGQLDSICSSLIMIIGWREQSTIRLFSLPNDTFGSE